MIRILKAPPFLTIQDLGRRGFRKIGVPLSGAMDRWAITRANALVGNPEDAAAFEWALGGGAIACDTDCVIALAGATVEINGKSAGGAAGSTFELEKRQRLEITRVVRGRFAYLSVSGGIDLPRALGSRSTYLPARIGGLDGRLLQGGDALPIGNSGRSAVDATESDTHDAPNYEDDRIRVIPFADGVGASARDRFFAGEYKVSPQSDRSGYRLDCAPIPVQSRATLSAAVCPGTIQLPPGGSPILLMADAPTIGGYPIVGVVCAADLPIIAQKEPGQSISFIRDA
ncbi:MAG TPA: biotin-dependent carboxyltransferase family protein [Gemmatimonadaceae bacterium]